MTTRSRKNSTWNTNVCNRVYSEFMRVRQYDDVSTNREIAQKISDAMGISTGEGVYKRLREMRLTNKYQGLENWFKSFSNREMPLPRPEKGFGKPAREHMVQNVLIEDHPDPVIHDNAFTAMSSRIDMLEDSIKRMSNELGDIHEIMNGLSDFQDELDYKATKNNATFTALLVANLALAVISAWMSFQ